MSIVHKRFEYPCSKAGVTVLYINLSVEL